MSDFVTITLIILSELAIVQLIAMTIFFIRRKKNPGVDMNQAKKTFEMLKTDSTRRDKLMPILTDTYELEDEELISKTVETILDEENALFRTAIKAIATSDFNSMQQISTQMRKNSDFYHDLVSTLKTKYKKETEETRESNKELQKDVDKLRGELKTTLDTMDRTLNEYANMYAAKSAESDEGFQDLKSSVDNAKQHAQFTMKKVNESNDSAEPNQDNTSDQVEESTSQDDIDALLDSDESSSGEDKNLETTMDINADNDESEDSIDMSFEKMDEVGGIDAPANTVAAETSSETQDSGGADENEVANLEDTALDADEAQNEDNFDLEADLSELDDLDLDDLDSILNDDPKAAEG